MNSSLAPRARLATLAFLALACGPFVQAADPPAEIHIPGARVFPESLTSSRDGSVYIGSILLHTIFRATSGSDSAQAWIGPGTEGLQSVFGVFADDQAGTLLACSNIIAGPPGGAPPQAPGELHVFDLNSGAPKGRYPFPTAGAFCNDIAVGPDGTAYATDTNNMQIVRWKRGAHNLEVWTPDGAFGPKGGALDGIAVLGHTVIVNTLATSKLFRIPIESDGKAGHITEVKLNRAIEHPDGMRSFGAAAVLIVEGGGRGRLSEIALHGDAGHVTTLKEGYPDGPVAVTVVGKTAYVLEGQLRKMRPDPNNPPNPFHATAVRVLLTRTVTPAAPSN